MWSMWNAPSDLDYYGQFDPEPPEEEEGLEDPEPPLELEEQWEAADRAMGYLESWSPSVARSEVACHVR